MTVKCLSKVVIGVNSAKTTLTEYEKTKPGANYAATTAVHNMAWRKLCAVYGHDMPKTHMDRIKDLLRLVEAYQGYQGYIKATTRRKENVCRR